MRESAKDITHELSEEIAGRVAPAGVGVVKSRLTRLAYAPEIAQAMLRRQQAEAVVAARQQIVEGAVGMVRLALGRLEEDAVVELDEERKAVLAILHGRLPTIRDRLDVHTSNFRGDHAGCAL